MLGFVLVTHAPLGDSIAQCVQHVMGSFPDGFEVVDVPATEDIDTTVKRIQDAARAVHAGAGVVFLTDLFGATPRMRQCARVQNRLTCLLPLCRVVTCPWCFVP